MADEHVIKNPYGIRNGRIIHISELSDSDRGLKCNCICPACEEPLIARLGERKVKHFAHKADCKNAIESALHMLAKEILVNNKQILLPAAYFECKEIVEPFIYSYTSVLIEEQIGELRPDAILIDGRGNRLFVEVTVTHQLDDDKIKVIVDNDYSVLEIDFSEYYYYDLKKATYSYLEERIINEIDNKYWINNRKENLRIKKILFERERATKLEEDNRKKIEEIKYRKSLSKITPIIREIKKYPNGLYPTNSDIELDKYWIRTNKFFPINSTDLPEYLDYPIMGEYVFDCDRRIWQTTLFSMYVLNSSSKYFRIEWIYKTIKKHNLLPINRILINSFRHEDELAIYEKKNGVSVPCVKIFDVLGEFFLNLTRLGFLHTGYQFEKFSYSYHWDFFVGKR